MKKLLLTIGVGILTAVCQAEIIKTSLGDIVLSDSGASKAAKGIVILRNPSDKPQTITTSLKKLFELNNLPREKARALDMRVTYSHDANVPTPKTAAEEFEISFGPFGLALVEYKL